MFVMLPGLLAAGDGDRLLERLDPLLRARVTAALLSLVILGLALVVFVWMGARMARRYAKSTGAAAEQARRRGAADDDWAGKPLASGDPPPDDYVE